MGFQPLEKNPQDCSDGMLYPTALLSLILPQDTLFFLLNIRFSIKLVFGNALKISEELVLVIYSY